MKLLTNKIILFLFIVFISINGYAEDPPDPTPPPETPINENLIALTLAGALLGLYIHKHKTKQKKTLN